MPWKKGQSGNAKGRPKGCGGIAVTRATLAESLPEVIEALIRKAKEGDVQAMRLLLDRTIPALRSEELPVVIDNFSGTRIELIAAVVEAIAQGKLDTARGGRLIVLLNPDALDERAAQVERILDIRNDDNENEE